MMTKDSEMERAWEKERKFLIALLGNENIADLRKPTFFSGYQAAKSASGWVRIEDIPEEWKDGRTLDLWVYGVRQGNCTYDLKCPYDLYWKCETEYGVINFPEEEITHAMLPLLPPQAET